MSKQSFENQYLINNKIIFLIGFMGSGKTTIGKELSKLLMIDFIDSDEWIEKKYGLTVQKIFELKGEAYFRSLETEFIDQINPLKTKVIATGGGLPCFNQSLEKIKQKGLVIYLKVFSDVIFERLKLDESRPLLQNLNFENKKLHISNKLNERISYYEQAHFTIDANNSIKKQLNEIKCLLF